jgi:hypothetical protein
MTKTLIYRGLSEKARDWSEGTGSNYTQGAGKGTMVGSVSSRLVNCDGHNRLKVKQETGMIASGVWQLQCCD